MEIVKYHKGDKLIVHVKASGDEREFFRNYTGELAKTLPGTPEVLRFEPWETGEDRLFRFENFEATPENLKDFLQKLKKQFQAKTN